MKKINTLSIIFIFIFLLIFFGISSISNAANITSNEYKVTTIENKSYVIGIYSNTKVKQLKENITANNNVEVYNNNKEKMNDEEEIKTGNVIKVGNKSYIAIVCGDVDGNGIAGLTDLVKIKKHVVGQESLLDEKKVAADIDVNGEITITDILNLKRLIIKIIDEKDIYEKKYSNDEFEYRKNNLTENITIVRLNDKNLNSTLKIPNKIDGNVVTKIEGALGKNSKVTEVIIPANIKNISNVAFSEFDNLTSIQVSELNEQYSSNEDILYNKEGTKLITYPRGKQVKEYFIKESVKEIAEYAFYNNSKTEKVYLSEKIEKVAKTAFSQMDGDIFIKENSKLKSILDDAEIVYKIDKIPQITKLTYSIGTNQIAIIDIQARDDEGIIAWELKAKDNAKDEWVKITCTNNLNITYNKINENGTYVLKVKDKAGNIASKEITVKEIDEIKPVMTSIKITNPTSGEYKPGTKITIRVEFNEKIKGTAPTLKLKIGNFIATGSISAKNPDGTKSYIDYEYIPNDIHTGKIETYSFSGGNITDTFGNKAEIKVLKNTGNEISIDAIKPKLNSIKIISPTSGQYQPGQKVTIRVNFSEKIKGLPPILKLKVGNDIVVENIGVIYPQGNTSYIDYIYTSDKNHTGRIDIYSYEGGSITDLCGNVAEIKKLSNTGNIITIGDTTTPKVISMKVISPISGNYQPGQKVTIRANFSEKIKGLPPILKLKVGNDIVVGNIGVIYPQGNTSYIDYIYTSDKNHTGRIDIYSYEGGSITDLYGNKAEIKTLSNTGSIITIADAAKAKVISMKVISPISGNYQPGQKVTIRVNFSEKIKGLPPILKLKVGNDIVVGNIGVIYPQGNTSYIDYIYTSDKNHTGRIDIYSYEGGDITDIYGNPVEITKLVNTGYVITIGKEIKPEVTSIQIINPVSGIYRSGQKIIIRVNYNKIIKGSAPILKLKIGNDIGTGLMTVSNPIGNSNFIDYTYTVNAKHTGKVEIYSYTGGYIIDSSGNLATVTTLPNSGNEITIQSGGRILQTNMLY